MWNESWNATSQWPFLWSWNLSVEKWFPTYNKLSKVAILFYPFKKEVSLGIPLGWRISLLNRSSEITRTSIKSNKELAWYNGWFRLDPPRAKPRTIKIIFVQLPSLYGQRRPRWKPTNITACFIIFIKVKCFEPVNIWNKVLVEIKIVV